MGRAYGTHEKNITLMWTKVPINYIFLPLALVNKAEFLLR